MAATTVTMNTETRIMPATRTAPANIVAETPAAEIQRIFNLQRNAQAPIANSTVRQRKARLNALHQAILNYRPSLKEALYDDYRKHPTEVDLAEIYAVTSELKHAKRHLSAWMSDQRVPTPLAFLGSSSRIKHEPKGVVLIISPWNFPVNLTFGPMVSAIAAGNTVVAKPSELTPHTSALIKRIVTEVFPEEEVAVVEGGVATTTSLLEQPFNHIFFTGSPAIGKVVMTAAAKHLASVTLELGGKNPTIVDGTADLDLAARRIAWSKYFNNGQICIAPDHVFIHKSQEEAFIRKVQEQVEKFYTGDPQREPSYNRIVNAHHFLRVKGYVDDAVAAGGKVRMGGTFDAEQNYIAPTLMTGVPENSALMTNEIFGPVLPVIAYTDIDAVIARINASAKPLGLYVYSRSRKNIRHILDNTRAGGSCVNHSAVHFFNPHLPFGGSNNSGIGKGHGRFGFEEFSNARAVLTQHMPGPLELLLMPYDRFKQKLIDLTIRFF